MKPELEERIYALRNQGELLRERSLEVCADGRQLRAKLAMLLTAFRGPGKTVMLLHKQPENHSRIRHGEEKGCTRRLREAAGAADRHALPGDSRSH